MTDLRLTEQESKFISDAEAAGYELAIFETDGKTRGILRGFPIEASSVKRNVWNPNRMNRQESKAVSQSLSSFGQVLDVIVAFVDDELTIIDGEHRHLNLAEEISVSILFGYSLAELKKLTVILNETRGSADNVDLAALLSSISEDFGDSLGDALPFSDKDISDLLALTTVDWSNYEDTFAEDDTTAVAENNAAPPAKPEIEPADESEPEYRTILCRIPANEATLLAKVHSQVAEQVRLSDNAAIAWGQVLGHIAASFVETHSAALYED